MGLTDVFLCPESHCPQIRERRGRSSWSHIVLRLERGEEGAHGFDSRLSVPSHIVIRLERGEKGAHGFDSRLSVPSHIILRLERGEEGAHGFDIRLSVPRVTSSSD
ncbi:hypothetical protein J6590_086874 [Homalodisca vitripennis]|nr:hypothetical protein J6590_086874 [Homalodisca vitripennis]